ncbi:MAG: hypothetical protein CVT74_14170 [Alphaproteobacteria bacterium HGW-Alphaproteobacteria-13]|jgi:hypothetical protein|nr:MAG: hypothetical protein CVT74_14170 [Alphaproteobacteria bacterium HGW-Alphaproteobacteria-13]
MLRPSLLAAILLLSGCAAHRIAPDYTLVDVTHGFLPDSVPRTMTYTDDAACLKTLAQLKKQAKRLERQADSGQGIAFASRDHLQLVGHWQRALLHHRIFQCEGRTLSIGESFETPNIPPPPPPPAPPPPIG